MKRSSVYIRPLLIIAVIVATLVGSSCRRQPTAAYTTLLDAERLLETSEGFDSGTIIFNTVDSAALRGDEHYLRDLLQAEINYKSYIDETDDSVIHAAAIYFDDIKDHPRFVRAKLIEGRIRYNRGDLQNAIISSLDGLTIAQSSKDTLAMARLNDLIADIYQKSLLRPHVIAKRRLAADYFKIANMPDHYRYALYEVGIAYYNNRQYDKSINLLDSLLTIIPASDSVFIGNIYRSILPSQIMSKKTDQAKETATKMMKYLDQSQLSSFDLANLTILSIRDSNFTEARKLLIETKNRISSSWDKFAYYDAQLRYYVSQSTDPEFIDFLTNFSNNRTDDEKILLSVPTITSERDYYKDNAYNSSLKALFYRRLLIVVIICTLLIVVFRYLRYINKRQKRIAELNILSSKFNENSAALFDINKKLAEKNEQFAKMEELIDRLYRDNFSLINKLSESFFENPDSENMRRRIARDIEYQITQMSDPAKIKELQDKIDLYFNNIFTNLSQQVPNLNEDELVFITYFYAGISPKATCLFMNIKIGNYYNRRSRIKAKIEESAASDKEIFLKPFNQRHQF